MPYKHTYIVFFFFFLFLSDFNMGTRGRGMKCEDGVLCIHKKNINT